MWPEVSDSHYRYGRGAISMPFIGFQAHAGISIAASTGGQGENPMRIMTIPFGLVLGLMSAPASGTLEALAPKHAVATAVAAPAPIDTRELTVPAGTVMSVKLQSSVGSDTSQPEQPVRGTLRRAVVSHGVQVLPVGTVVL